MPEDEWEMAYERRSGTGGNKEMAKTCPICSRTQHIAKRKCIECNYSFYEIEEIQESPEKLVLMFRGNRHKFAVETAPVVPVVRKKLLQIQRLMLPADVVSAIQANVNAMHADTGCAKWNGLYVSRRPIIRTLRGDLLARQAIYEHTSGVKLKRLESIGMTCGNAQCVAFQHMEKRDLHVMRAVAS
jgi:hypothetical protein